MGKPLTLEEFEKEVVAIEERRIKDIMNIKSNASMTVLKLFNRLSPDDQLEVRKRQQAAIDAVQSKIVKPNGTMH